MRKVKERRTEMKRLLIVMMAGLFVLSFGSLCLASVVGDEGTEIDRVSEETIQAQTATEAEGPAARVLTEEDMNPAKGDKDIAVDDLKYVTPKTVAPSTVTPVTVTPDKK